MNRKEMFIWLVYAGLGVQLTTSAQAIDTMTIAIMTPGDVLPGEFVADVEKLAEMAKELISWRFHRGRRPRWIKRVLPTDHPFLSGCR